MSEISQSDKDILLRTFSQGVIAVDLETTGLSPLVDKIIELSAIKVTPSGIDIFDQLIDPEILIPPHTIEIHGITDEMVKGKPKLADVLTKFIEFVGDLPLIAHNAKFDIGFLVFQAHKHGMSFGRSNVYCSCKYARSAIKNMPNYKLGTLSSELKIPLENHHRALDDAIASLLIYKEGLDRHQSFKPDHGFLFKISDFSKNKDLSIPTKLEPLIEATEKQLVVKIKYKGGSMRGKMRPIKPLALLPMPAGNILYAHCLVSNLYKSFSLAKIIELEEVEGKEARELLKNVKTISPK